MSKTATIEEILEGHEISGFARSWIKNSRADDASIRNTYEFLKKIGISDERIATQA